MTSLGPVRGAGVLAAADPELAAAVTAQLEDVEARFREVAQSAHPLLTEAGQHLITAGGKRVRPLLALLAARLGDPFAPGVVDAAVVVELTHVATLYHDDVMDDAALRHGVPSANARWTNTVAILTGDFLLARASDLTAGLGPAATHLQARAFGRLVEGQIAETAGPAEGEDPVSHHFRVIADKTASLFATSTELGAMTAGAPAADVARLARFGEVLGTAFQLSDDLIDIRSESDASGKTPGTDLREGIRTLPALLVLATDDPASARLRELVSRPLPDDAEQEEALALLRAHPALQLAQDRLAAYVDEARDAARGLPDGSARDALLGLADFVLARSG